MCGLRNSRPSWNRDTLSTNVNTQLQGPCEWFLPCHGNYLPSISQHYQSTACQYHHLLSTFSNAILHSSFFTLGKLFHQTEITFAVCTILRGTDSCIPFVWKRVICLINAMADDHSELQSCYMIFYIVLPKSFITIIKWLPVLYFPINSLFLYIPKCALMLFIL